ncbi:PorP/SprF family type IX secretion system membrane protein [Echinicola marina]|uniref:PorP/SprF family type IX secretion system membrane protein n=1 Tax=Echinicola marina TaxID=2859768 RepID=UPI001CF67455|nr:PorP/SprF family type IX secretion system membrane protein [Echinicola marina]UCS93967.1 PorP/SprF family type IX secretion system membrane protein [Echinicola marina]
MKRSLIKITILGVFLLLVIFTTKGQNRKYHSQFNAVRGYTNPALVGLEGSLIRGVARNQWVGFNGAPTSYLFLTEIDLPEFFGKPDSLPNTKNAIGISILHDKIGAFNDTEINASYAVGINLSQELILRLGATFQYNTVNLDGNKLNTQQVGDPKINQYVGSFASMQIYDFNLGAGLVHPNFYLGYSIHHLNKGRFNAGDVFVTSIPFSHFVQSGFRFDLNDDMKIGGDFLLQEQVDLPVGVEFNIKTLFKDKIWVGMGHRIDYSNNFQLGVLLSDINFSYTYEIPRNRTFRLPNTTHEFVASFRLFSNSIRKYPVFSW